MVGCLLGQRMRQKGDNMLKMIKIATGSVISILLADALGLDYSASAGIITLLTIQDTTKETIVISIKRIMAFLLAAILSYMVFYVGGYRVLSYGVFLFLFIACCKPLRLGNAVSTNAVLVTHYLQGGGMSLAQVGNEAMLLLIGAGIGTLFNLYMPGKGKEIRAMQKILEADLRNVLLRMSDYICREDKSDYTDSCFGQLAADIAKGQEQAYAYRNNTFLQESQYFIEYMNMREQQCVILREIYKKIINIRTVFPQTKQVAAFIHEIGSTFGESNNAKKLLEMLSALLYEMKNSSLPQAREEFEERALLYSILMDLQYFLLLKKEFVKSLTAEQIQRYWQEK